MKLGVDSAIGMKSDLQTNVLPFVVDKEIIVQAPRQSWRGAGYISRISLIELDPSNCSAHGMER
jgi:hypothetical protein